jgi:hypothetical protein
VRDLGGGLLIHPDLFAQTDFRLFCLRYALFSYIGTPPFAVYCSASVQQKNLWLSSLNWALNRQYGLVAKPSGKSASNSINTSAFAGTNPKNES